MGDMNQPSVIYKYVLEGIYKYVLEGSRSTVLLPEGACVLHFGEDGNQNLCIWVKHDGPDSPPVTYKRRAFAIYGTGHPIFDNDEDEHEFIGTCVMRSGLVFHLFEVTP